MSRRTQYIAIAAVIALMLVLLKLPGDVSSRLKLAVSSIFLPLFGLSGSANRIADATGNALLPKAEILQQNAKLREEINGLRIATQQSAEVFRENERLRQFIGWQRQLPWKTRAARVMSRDPANWWRTVQIDLGTAHGMRANLAVISTDGLVGKIASCGDNRSTVVMLGDPTLRVSALIQETRDHGIVMAGSSGSPGSEFIDLGFLSRSSQLKAGQAVITSGDGGVFPKGIFVGRVVDSRTVGYGLSIEARVKLAADLGKLEQVWVILE